jgi:hypothetical protein
VWYLVAVASRGSERSNTWKIKVGRGKASWEVRKSRAASSYLHIRQEKGDQYRSIWYYSLDLLLLIADMPSESTFFNPIVLGEVDVPQSNLSPVREIKRLSDLGDQLIILRERVG